MSTNNFFYKNRCVVVTDEDYECGNTPSLGNRIQGDSYELENHNNGLLTKVIVLTYGYYEGACIDFFNTEKSIGDELCYECYTTKREFMEQVSKTFGIAKKILSKVLPKSSKGYNYRVSSKYVEDCVAKADEVLGDMEEKECNRRIDEIKKNYGYAEYRCTGVFSNGSGIYEKID